MNDGKLEGTSEEESDEGACHTTGRRNGKKNDDFGPKDAWVKVVYSDFPSFDERLDTTI